MPGTDRQAVLAAAEKARTKLLTFESWLTKAEWYDYALDHPDLVPFPLTDRSPCQDPFFDPFADPAHRRPVISGLCRGRAMKNFSIGDRFIYITRIAPQLTDRYAHVRSVGPHYFAVAALRVVRVWQSHSAAAADFAPRRYVPVPEKTSYPPNLAFADGPSAAAARECAIVHDKRNAYIPDEATDRMWREQYLAYRFRQVKNQLRAAECQIEAVGGLECLQLAPDKAPVLTPQRWGGLQMNVTGRWISEQSAQRIRDAIAETA
jgi:hypothetical protein